MVGAHFFIIWDITFPRISICFEHSFYSLDWCLVNPRLKAGLQAAGAPEENILCQPRETKRKLHHLIQLPEKHPQVPSFLSYQNWRWSQGFDRKLKHSTFKRNLLKCKPILTCLSLSLLDAITRFSGSVVSNSLQAHELQHARPPCPSPAPGVYSSSCPLSQWCHPTTSSSVAPFSSCLQSFPASGSFLMSQFFTSGGRSTGVHTSSN